MPHWDEAKYPTAFAAKVWNVPVPTAKLYVKKYLWLTPNDRKAHTSGATTLLTGRRVLQGAIGAHLAHSFRTGAAKACEAAKAFTDFSYESDAPGFNRDPGELYAGSLTCLAVYPDGQTRVIRTEGVENKKFNTKTKKTEVVIEKPTVEDITFGSGQRGACWLLPLDFIVKHVTIELDKFDSEARS